MAKAHYVGVDGVARKVTKHYVGVDGVARKVKSGYIGVNGVARQYCSQSKVVWTKCNANVYPNYIYTRTNEGVGQVGGYVDETSTSTSWGAAISTGFSSTSGFIGYDYYAYDNPRMLVGKYYVTSDTVYEIINADYFRNGISIEYVVIAKAITTFSHNDYKKGTTSYGNITALDNGLPEEGTLVAGSISGSYCVLEINGNYYYYEKQ